MNKRLKIRKHPAAKAFETWISSADGKGCIEGVQLGAELHGHYMENRCHRAFNAGWLAASKLLKKAKSNET